MAYICLNESDLITFKITSLTINNNSFLEYIKKKHINTYPLRNDELSGVPYNYVFA